MSRRIAPGVTATERVHETTAEAVEATRVTIAVRQAEAAKRKEERKKMRKELREGYVATNAPFIEEERYSWVFFDGSALQQELIQLTEEIAQKNEEYYHSVVGQVPQRVPKPNWGARVREQVIGILTPAFEGEVTPEATANLFDDSVPDWHASYTDPTWDADDGKNYEQNEKLGDSTAKTALYVYLIDAGKTSGKHVSEHELTIAVNTILAKQEQARVSRALGLPKLLRTLYATVTVGQEEDMLEAFFGALYIAGEKAGSVGQSLCNMLMYYLIEVGYIKIPERFDTPPKTQITHLFSMLGWGAPFIRTEREGSKYVSYIYFSEEAKRTINSKKELMMLDIYDAKRMYLGQITEYPRVDMGRLRASSNTGGLIGTGNGSNPSLSELNAYKAAVTYFRDVGLLREVQFEEYLKRNQTYNISLDSAFFPALQKAMSEGYDNIFAADVRQAADRDVALLYGLKGNSKIVIYMIYLNDNRDASIREKEPRISKTEMRRILYTKYAEDNSRAAYTESHVSYAEGEEEEGESDVEGEAE